MSAKYYYLIASLPSLRFAEESSIATAGFIGESKKWLLAGDMQILFSAGLKNMTIEPYDTEVLKEWKRFNFNFKKELALIRQAEKFSKKFQIPEMLKPIFEQGTPLLKETAFENARWQYLDGKSGLYNFDINWLVLYFLKLQISERLAQFSKDEGEKTFYELCGVKHEKTEW